MKWFQELISKLKHDIAIWVGPPHSHDIIMLFHLISFRSKKKSLTFFFFFFTETGHSQL